MVVPLLIPFFEFGEDTQGPTATELRVLRASGDTRSRMLSRIVLLGDTGIKGVDVGDIFLSVELDTVDLPERDAVGDACSSESSKDAKCTAARPPSRFESWREVDDLLRSKLSLRAPE